MQLTPILYFVQTLTVIVLHAHMPIEHAHVTAARVHVAAGDDRFHNLNSYQF